MTIPVEISEENRLLAELERREQRGNRTTQAQTCEALGLLYQEQGRLDQAESLYCRALSLSEEIGNRAGRASACIRMGLLCEIREDLTQAASILEDSLETYRMLEDRQGEALACGYLVYNLL